MTALELIKLGVRFVPGEPAKPPPWRRDLAATIAAEVQRRLARMRDWTPTRGTYGACAHCGDAMTSYTSGTCGLCALARRASLQDWRLSSE